MKYSLLILFFGVLFFASCGGAGKSNSSDSADGLKFEDFDQSLISLLQIEGEIVDAKVWTDSIGKNVLVLSQMKDTILADEGPSSSETRLMAKHFVKEGGSYRLLSEINEVESDCVMDNRAAFSTSLLAVTDLDKNGIAEIIIVYRLGCSSELSPDPLRLVLSENGNQHKITGSTIADYAEWKDGGETHLDPTFEKLNEAQRNEAMRIWEKAQASYESFE